MYLSIELDRLDPHPEKRVSLEDDCKFLLNGSDVRDGDVLIIRGGEAILHPLSLYLLKKYVNSQVDFIFESYGSILHSDYVISIIHTYKIRELRVHLYSLNLPENDRRLFSGQGMRCLMGIKTLINHNFRDISLITTVSDPDIKRVEGLLKFIEEVGLHNLYIRFEEETPAVRRVGIIGEFTRRFAGEPRVIIENNGFNMGLSGKNDPIEMRSDPTTATVNLVIRNLCTSNCIFCTTRIVGMANNAPLPYDSRVEVIRAIKKETKRLKDARTLEIVAVEPLEHPEIIDILKEASALGFNYIRLLTHGRLLSDKRLLNALRQNRVKEIIIPVAFHSLKSAVLNVRDRHHYYELLQAFENIKGFRGIKFVFNIMISKMNYREIQKIYKFIKGYGFENINFNLALPSIEDERFYIPYAVRFSEILSSVARIKDTRLKNSIIRSLLYPVPICIIIRFFGDIWKDIVLRDINNRRPATLAFQRASARPKATSECRKAGGCPHSEYCVGVNRIYLRVFGDEEFYF